MNKNTVYILQKDLPFAKAGAEFIRENEDADYYNTNFANYHDRIHKSRVINNIEWFKPKEEPQWEILEFEHSSGKATFVLNEDKKYFCEDFKDEYFTLDDLLHNKLGKTYNITNVKRLSDGEVFSVGDKVISDANIQAPHTVIDSITIVNDYMIYFNSIPFDRAIKVKLEAPKEEQVVKLYTESELLQACRDAFDAASEFTHSYVGDPEFPNLKTKFKTREDYINSLK